MSVKYNIIVAATEEGGIGLKNDLPWKLEPVDIPLQSLSSGGDFFILKIISSLSILI